MEYILNFFEIFKVSFGFFIIKIERPVETPIGNVALSICYDVRFSELALLHRHNGAHILTYPSAFTLNTGLAHWEVIIFAFLQCVYSTIFQRFFKILIYF